jgi:hypothetical protein
VEVLVEVDVLLDGCPVRRIPAPAATTMTTAIMTTTGVCFVVSVGPFAGVKLCAASSRFCFVHGVVLSLLHGGVVA